MAKKDLADVQSIDVDLASAGRIDVQIVMWVGRYLRQRSENEERQRQEHD